MDLAYSLVIVALCGAVEAMPSPDGAGLARTRTADKIGGLFRLRPASRSAELIHRPALSSFALSAWNCTACILVPAIGEGPQPS